MALHVVVLHHTALLMWMLYAVCKSVAQGHHISLFLNSREMADIILSSWRFVNCKK